LLLVVFCTKKEKINNINKIKKYQSELPNLVICIKNSLRYMFLGELLKSLNILNSPLSMLPYISIIKNNIPSIENSIFKFFITLDG